MTDHILIEFNNVSFHDPNSGYSLKNVSFSLRQGENLILLGPEGSGKELIVSLVTAKLFAQQGAVLFHGRNIAQFSEEEIETMRSRIGYVSYTFGLINNMNVFDNIALPLRYHTSLQEKQIKQKIEPYLEKYELSRKYNLRPQMLNESEKLRAAFIRALVAEPEILLVDHVLDAQCPLATARFIDIATEDIFNRNVSFILTAYRPQFFFSKDNRYLVFYRGRMVFSGTGAELMATNNPYVQQYLQTPLMGPMRSFYSREVADEV